MSSSHVVIENCHYLRGTRAIFNGLNMHIPRGKITAIMGPSGTGKTTLLRLIGAQLAPTQGQILVNEQDMHQLSAAQLQAARRQMGLLFQNAALFTSLSVFENVAFPLREHTQLPEEFIRDIVLMKLQSVGLRGARDLMPSELSGGMARRVALARAIALDPQLIMYDEPFVGQDPISLGVLVKLIKSLNETLGLTSIIVSHDVEETCSIADFVHIIANGNVIASGSPAQIRENPDPMVRQFIQGLPDGAVPFHYPARAYTEELLNA